MSLSQLGYSPFCGTLAIPPDSAASLDTMLLAALAVGQSKIENIAKNEATKRFAQVLTALGVVIEACPPDSQVIWGVGVTGFAQSDSALDADEHTLPLLLGALAGHPFDSHLQGDAQLATGLKELMDPLAVMGVTFPQRQGRQFPLLIAGQSELMPITWQGIGTQALSRVLLLAGLHAPGATTLTAQGAWDEPLFAALAHAGADVEVAKIAGGTSMWIHGLPELRPCHWTIAGNPRLAAALLAAIACRAGTKVCLRNVPQAQNLTWLMEALRATGARIHQSSPRACYGGTMVDLAIEGVRPTALVIDAPTDLAEPEALVLAAGLSLTSRRSTLRGFIRTVPKLAEHAQCLTACGLALDVVGDDLVVGGPSRPAATIARERPEPIELALLTARPETLIWSGDGLAEAAACLQALADGPDDKGSS